MCLEAEIRAARDFDFDCSVIAGGYATRDLKYGNTAIKAEDVHLSTLSSLKGACAKIRTKEEFLRK